MCRDALAFLRRRLGYRHLPQIELLGITLGNEALALGAEDLPAEPLDLMPQGADLLAQCRDLLVLRAQYRGDIRLRRCSDGVGGVDGRVAVHRVAILADQMRGSALFIGFSSLGNA